MNGLGAGLIVDGVSTVLRLPEESIAPPSSLVASSLTESRSLNPSVGNWSFPCRSHYFIRRNRIRWTGAWSPEEVEEGRHRDRIAKGQYFADVAKAGKPTDTKTTAPIVAEPRPTLWEMFTRWLPRKARRR